MVKTKCVQIVLIFGLFVGAVSTIPGVEVGQTLAFSEVGLSLMGDCADGSGTCG